ncbi:hypothetical protein PHYBLDRAFT_65845 [Phycomyces blakesleeanus NRRL 1555(-)]|uniref:Uncharacterized protein n=1 Tax=Phycomyces blakesleeanus (strain ATCC 8743b / DSM 1359 / FGSC 10004 / NBRC 33097 / NRRL 1555) TaxID=763407 RepID=A0A162U3Z5_PHYB8|nr:hypothetical protein PHYBLDRAFT_65845 [Phycomyces blakesleeanus NRRL 1555(-)]OAD73242.1 hypothetical protein PHYBLDRAFT_65845 [Phycomyces blakesleeanus NRRL 1555(-)]|eukprot:XP_018291282.1 hypothetical protein PHYBLDRAFT_65845 [Phycomyces blakesleeanus NRRL 1555(-)]
MVPSQYSGLSNRGIWRRCFKKSYGLVARLLPTQKNLMSEKVFTSPHPLYVSFELVIILKAIDLKWIYLPQNENLICQQLSQSIHLYNQLALYMVLVEQDCVYKKEPRSPYIDLMLDPCMVRL